MRCETTTTYFLPLRTTDSLSLRKTAEVTAADLINSHFPPPDCLAAFLAGSVVRGETTCTSDPDLVIISATVTCFYRASFVEFGWPIETFVHRGNAWLEYFAIDAARRRPALPMMCAGTKFMVSETSSARP